MLQFMVVLFQINYPGILPFIKINSQINTAFPDFRVQLLNFAAKFFLSSMAANPS